MANEIKNVFISHIHEDDSKLGDLKSLLEKRGVEVRDYSINSDKPNQAKNPDYIKQEILAPQIDRCSVLVVYVTEETKSSEYVDWEIEYAHKKGKRIVGVWGQGEKDCELPEALDQYRDALVGWDSASIADAILDDDPIQENQDGSDRPRRTITRHPCK